MTPDIDGLVSLLHYMGDQAEFIALHMPDGSIITLEDELAVVADMAIYDALMIHLITMKEAQMCSGV